MIDSALSKFMSTLMLILVPIASLIIYPWGATEPVDQPKMLITSILAFSLFALLTVDFKNIIHKKHLKVLGILFLFVTQLTITLFTSGANFVQQFFGAFGRNTGLLTYLSLAIICFCAYILSSEIYWVRINIALLSTGLISIFYGLLQLASVDPIKWNNIYSPIIEFLGNPDFASSFMGMCSIVALAYFFRPGLNKIWRLGLAIYYLVSIVLILKSHAQQGLLISVLGSVFVIYYFQKTNLSGIKNARFISITYLLLVYISGFLVIAGTLHKGPLNFLYKVSVRQRGFYWHAAWEMLKSKPFNGVGLDSYGEWYFKFRSANAILHSPNTQSNAAHNVFLDLASNGGILLLLSYLTLVGLAFWRGIRYISNLPKYNWAPIGLFFAWIAFEAQNLVSINQIGIGIWGWVLTGSVLGMTMKTNRVEKSLTGVSRKIHKSDLKNFKIKIRLIIGIIVGSLVAGPYFSADVNYRKAINGRNVQEIIKASNAYPFVTDRSVQAAQLLAQNKFTLPAEEILQKVVKVQPRNYNAWILISQLADPKSQISVEAKRKISELTTR